MARLVAVATVLGKQHGRIRMDVFCWELIFSIPDIDNDPSAGSSTETLLRILLPLNDQV